MATARHQRIGILIILVVTVVGTIGSFLVMVLSSQNSQKDAQAQQKLMSDYQNQINEQAKAHAASSKPLNGYAAAAFDKASVAKLQVETLVDGTGDTLAATDSISANYFGWTGDGKIFDSSNQNGTTTPVTFGLNGVIKGWTEGLTGIKVGSTVKLTIPADLAYGAAGSPPSIGPNEPLQFIVQVIEKK